jgi:hypothetical protein
MAEELDPPPASPGKKFKLAVEKSEFLSVMERQ